jgi:hypothetical protein
MLRRALCISLAGLGLLVPAAAAKPPAATVGKPSVTSIRVLRTADRVVVRVLVRHVALADAAPGARAVGTVTVVLARYVSERNRAIAGGSDAWALPVATGVDAVYEIAVRRAQTAAVEAAARDGVLRALVLVDERVVARGRAPARGGGFRERDVRIVDAPAPAPVAPPYLVAGGHVAVIDADAAGRQAIAAVTIAAGGGRTLVIAGRTPVPADGTGVQLRGRATLGGAPFAVPTGLTLAISPTGRRRGTLVWPEVAVAGAAPVAAGSALLAPPPTR